MRHVSTVLLPATLGALAGFAALAPSAGVVFALVCGALVGACFGFATRRSFGAWIDSACGAGALALGLWSLEVLLGRPPVVSRLVAWLLYGVTMGFAVAFARDAVRSAFGPPIGPARREPAPVRNVVVLGGGFAGITAAKEIERRIGADATIEITLVSDTNALLFTPMLAEVAASSVEPTHISTPVRSSLRRTTVLQARVSAIDLGGREIRFDDDERRLRYDHVILALGSVSNFLGLENVARHALGFRTLGDAIRIRNRVIAMLERADRERDPRVRRRFLTFVVAGGGFAGAELAGGLNDFARGALASYRHVPASEVTIVVVHAGERILPELGAALGTYAQTRMAARGVTFRLASRVADAAPGSVTLTDGTVLEAETLIWTAGIKPHALVGTLGVATDRRGAVVVDDTLAIPGHSGAWALGDCASATDPATGRPHPPTAQVAIRQAAAVARNVCATLAGGRATPARFASLGALCVVGHRTACAELALPSLRGRSVRFSGTFAWLLWRGIYLAKLPGSERKTRVLFDWIVELFVPRDIVQTLDIR